MLLFIGILYALCKQIYCVSIHLMLLFIERLISLAVAGFLFQYISCYSLSLSNCLMYVLLIRFNTSHVTLYHYLLREARRYTRVSIHLMLLFIILFQSCGGQKSCFNTSHVTLYQLALERCSIGDVVSIHLMLLFIMMNCQRI